MDEDYAREITRHAVLRTSMALGFKSVREECLDVVGDVVRQFVQTIASRARDSAETGGRACGGIQDVLPTLESMVRMYCMRCDDMHNVNPSVAFVQGPFDVSWKALRDFGLEVDESKQGENSAKWDQPFPFEVPMFPVCKPLALPFSDTDLTREKNKHDDDAFVPAHLPPYPSSHTYQSQLGKKRRSEEVQALDENVPKKPKPALNTKHARESLMKLENLPVAGETSNT